MKSKKPIKKNKNYKSNTNSKRIVDDKLKPIRPTLREKKRFVKVKIISDKKFSFKELSESLIEEIIFYIGAIDFGKSGIWILRDKFNEKEQELILKVGTKKKDKLIGALALIKNIKNSKLKLEVVRVSGTLKGVQKEISKK